MLRGIQVPSSASSFQSTPLLKLICHLSRWRRVTGTTMMLTVMHSHHIFRGLQSFFYNKCNRPRPRPQRHNKKGTNFLTRTDAFTS